MDTPSLYLCPAVHFAHVDPLVGGCPAAIARHRYAKRNNIMLFSVRSMPRQVQSSVSGVEKVGWLMSESEEFCGTVLVSCC
jgi:hypothetical protein